MLSTTNQVGNKSNNAEAITGFMINKGYVQGVVLVCNFHTKQLIKQNN